MEVTLLTSHLHTVLKPQPFSIIQITLKPTLSRLQSLTNFVQKFEAEAIEFGPKASKKTQPNLAPSKFKAPLSLHQKTKPLSNVSAKSYPRLFSTIPDPHGHSEKNIPIRGKGPEPTARSPPTCPAPIPLPSHLAIHGRRDGPIGVLVVFRRRSLPRYKLHGGRAQCRHSVWFSRTEHNHFRKLLALLLPLLATPCRPL